MHKHWYVTWILFVVATALAACSDSPCVPDEPELPGEPPLEENAYAYMRLHINMDGRGLPGSRAEQVEPPYEHVGSNRENALTSMDILICDDVNGTIRQFYTLAQVQLQSILNNETVGINVPVEGWAPVHIYALVNMPDDIRRLFVPGKKISDIGYASTGSSYEDVINEYVAGSNGHQTMLEAGGTGSIPMTGQFVMGETGETGIVLANGIDKDNPLVLKVDMCRIVAKAHLLVKWLTAGAAGVKYVYALDTKAMAGSASGKDNEVNAKWLGWMRVDNVRYIPNGINKSTFVLPHASSTGSVNPAWDDMNMSLDWYITGGMDFDIDFDANAWTRDFVYYNGMDLHRNNVSDNSELAHAECYVEETYSNTINDREGAYTEGMYCLENFFHEPDARGRFDTYEGSVPMITHLSVAAKLTPRWIVIRENFLDMMTDFVNNYNYMDANKFNKEYGLTPGDFGDEDVARWERIKEYYKDDLTGEGNIYRDIFRIFELDREADAIDILNWSLMGNHLWSGDANDFERGLYPPETFYCYDVKYDTQAQGVIRGIVWNQQYLYLSAGAVAAAATTDATADITTYSVPHLGGWCYYFTYFNDTQQPLVDGKVPYTASQVTRNKYYLTTIGNFGSPGGTITRPEYIKVNTVPVAWHYAGHGEVNLH